MKIYCTLSVAFATLCAILTCSTYLVFTQWSCLGASRSYIYGIPWWDSYIFCKIFLYLIFIERLFNPHYRRIYSYPTCFQYTLWMLLVVLFLTMIIDNICDGVLLTNLDYPYAVSNINDAVYAIIDSAISIVTMILFFIPFCRQIRAPVISNNLDVSVIKKYCILSLLQLIAALSFQLAMGARIYMDIVDVPISTVKKFNCIVAVIQILDCLLIIICIYFGFARKKTSRSCVQICKYWCVWVSCHCLIDDEYSEHFAQMDLLSQDNGNGNEPILLIDCEYSEHFSIGKSPIKSTVQSVLTGITATSVLADIQYLQRREVKVQDPKLIEVTDSDEYGQIG